MTQPVRDLIKEELDDFFVKEDFYKLKYYFSGSFKSSELSIPRTDKIYETCGLPLMIVTIKTNVSIPVSSYILSLF